MNGIRNKKQKVAIIGAGVAGLALAIRLAAKNYEVQVFEANSYAGGKLSEIRQDGFRFDAGPSLFTQPKLIEELLELNDCNTLEYFSYTRLPIICKYFYEDGTQIDAFSNPKKFAFEVYHKTGEHPRNVYQHLLKSKRMYEATEKVFLQSSLHKWSTYFRWSTLTAIFALPQLTIFKNMNKANEQRFTDSRVRQLFNRFATYNGSNPYQAPATLNLIPHLEHNMGAYFPTGGMYQITKTLLRLAQEMGVIFHFNTRINSISIKQKKAVGIEANQEFQPFDKIVSTMDVYYTYRKLMPKQPAPETILNQPKSSSALVFYWGIKQTFPQLDLHNIFFSQDYAAEFAHIFEYNTIYSDPTIYLNITSKYQKSDAPEGCENWFCMINVPPNTGQDWDTLIEQARRNIIQKLNRLLKTDIASLIQTEAILDPRKLELRTSAHMGALYGNNSNNRMAAFLRHPNFSNKIHNLYFCGGTVHPGGGIPLCLSSAKIVADLL